MDSDQGWTSLTLQELGGFAAVRRGNTLQRAELAPQARAPADALVSRLLALPVVPQDRVPDAQQLVVDVTTGEDKFTRVFDRSDLPADVDALLQLVRGVRPFKPM